MPKGYPNNPKPSVAKTMPKVAEPEAEIYGEDFTLQAFDQPLAVKCENAGVSIDENAYHYSFCTKVWHDKGMEALAQAAGISYESMLHMGYEKVTDDPRVCPFNNVLMRIDKRKWDARENVVNKPIGNKIEGNTSVTISTEDYVDLKGALEKMGAHKSHTREDSKRRIETVASAKGLDAFKDALGGPIADD